MSVDFEALTAGIVMGLPDIRVCLLTTRDGLALGAYPKDEAPTAQSRLVRMFSVGNLERGFVALSEEVWVFCRRGPYAAIAVAAPTSLPGLILDRLEQLLIVTEESRAHARLAGSLVQSPDRSEPWPSPSPERSAPTSHPIEAVKVPGPVAEVVKVVGARVEELSGEQPSRGDPSVGAPEGEDGGKGPHPRSEPDRDVDRFSLSREFSGLYGEEKG